MSSYQEFFNGEYYFFVKQEEPLPKVLDVTVSFPELDKSLTLFETPMNTCLIEEMIAQHGGMVKAYNVYVESKEDFYDIVFFRGAEEDLVENFFEDGKYISKNVDNCPFFEKMFKSSKRSNLRVFLVAEDSPFCTKILLASLNLLDFNSKKVIPAIDMFYDPQPHDLFMFQGLFIVKNSFDFREMEIEFLCNGHQYSFACYNLRDKDFSTLVAYFMGGSVIQMLAKDYFMVFTADVDNFMKNKAVDLCRQEDFSNRYYFKSFMEFENYDGLQKFDVFLLNSNESEFSRLKMEFELASVQRELNER